MGHIQAKVSAATQSQAAFEAIKRIVPERAQEFSVEVDQLAVNGKDSFQVSVYHIISTYVSDVCMRLHLQIHRSIFSSNDLALKSIWKWI